jgi:hypothetical protein
VCFNSLPLHVADPLKGRHVILEILDTAGTEQFSKYLLLPHTRMMHG